MVKLGDAPQNAQDTGNLFAAASEVDEMLGKNSEKPSTKPRKKRKTVPPVTQEAIPMRDMVGQVAEMVLAQGYSVRDLKHFCNLIPKALRMGWKNRNRPGIQG
jgi:hypothetical protein